MMMATIPLRIRDQGIKTGSLHSKSDSKRKLKTEGWKNGVQEGW
jgi:hypothetical protein